MRYYSSTASRTQLTLGAGASDTVLQVASVSGFPGSTPFTLLLDGDTAAEEIVTVNSVSGLSLTVTRGQDGTGAVAHAVGCDVRHAATARDYAEPQAHMAATTGIHGVTGALVGTTDTQALTNKTISGSNNTISNVPKTALPSTVVYTTDTQTLTGKTISGSSNTITNVPSTALPSNTAYTDATQTLTNKTISGTANTFSAVPTSALTGVVAKGNLPNDTVYTAGLPVIDGGEKPFAFNGGTTLTQTIAFTAGKFSTPPNVVVSVRTAYRNVTAKLDSSPTTAGVGVRVESVDSGAITGTVYVQWIAIQ